nr:MAG: hypothetical protein DIU52_00295 [bacterium]
MRWPTSPTCRPRRCRAPSRMPPPAAGTCRASRRSPQRWPRRWRRLLCRTARRKRSTPCLRAWLCTCPARSAAPRVSGAPRPGTARGTTRSGAAVS